MTKESTTDRPPSADDEDLVRRCKAGDRSAQSAFVERYKTLLFRRLLRMTGSFTLAEDLTQEALVRALTRLPTFHTMVNLDGWVMRIASNLAHDYFRAQAVRNERPLEYALHTAVGGEPEDVRMVSDEERRLVGKALASLPDSYREVLMLAHYDDRPLQEIASVLGVGLSAVKMRLLRGRAMLLKALEKLYE